MSEQPKPLTEKEVEALPDVPLKEFSAMAEIMIRQGMVRKDKNKSPSELIEELKLKLYYCKVHGIPEIYANQIYIIQGNFTQALNLMDTLVSSKYRQAEFECVLNEVDKISIRTRKNKKSPWLMCTWDVARAEKAGNTKGLYWQRDPQAALRNAVWKDVYRTHYRDALAGMIYTPEDFGVSLDANGDIIEPLTKQDVKDLNETERQLEPKYEKPTEKLSLDQILDITKEAKK